MRTGYKCRAYPTPEQAAVFNRTFGCVRLVWNKTLADRHAAYFQRGEKQTEDLAFLSEVSSVPLQQTLRHQHTSFANFFGLHIAKTTGPLALAWSWPGVDLAALDPTMVIVARDTDGRWYATLAVDTADPAPLPEIGHEVGVDLGVKDFAVLSTGERIANPRHLERKARNLARYQRRLARCRKGSMNRRKAEQKVAAAHRKVRNARQDFLHKTSTRLVRSADLIAVEDLAVKNMVGNRSLSKAISDCGWGEFRRDACGADVRRQGATLPQSAVKQETPGATRGISRL